MRKLWSKSLETGNYSALTDTSKCYSLIAVLRQVNENDLHPLALANQKRFFASYANASVSQEGSNECCRRQTFEIEAPSSRHLHRPDRADRVLNKKHRGSCPGESLRNVLMRANGDDAMIEHEIFQRIIVCEVIGACFHQRSRVGLNTLRAPAAADKPIVKKWGGYRFKSPARFYENF